MWQERKRGVSDFEPLSSRRGACAHSFAFASQPLVRLQLSRTFIKVHLRRSTYRFIDGKGLMSSFFTEQSQCRASWHRFGCTLELMGDACGSDIVLFWPIRVGSAIVGEQDGFRSRRPQARRWQGA
jgi:hypothetical protein